ncbi:carbohydrate ABC transporter permease [Paenibacillus sp. GCM10027626]|uniref:carbohydrate ABC transporter permease n=1 Tax=Paenibacillus sp. GCM10027626 TaxID=3273411 RepID=UPI003640A608
MRHRSKDRTLFHLFGYLYLGCLSLICLFPLWLIFAGSFSSEEDVIRHGYELIPRNLSVAGYKMMFEAPEAIIRSMAVSVALTMIGVVCGVFLTAMTAYVIQRKDFKYRNVISFYIYLTSVFTGGLVPWYIMMVNYFHMRNNFLALIIPLLFNVFYILIMKSFFRSIPDAIVESGKIDGAGEFTIFLKLVLPIAKPGLATISLFIALSYWNDWFSAMLFINKDSLVPLQLFLYNLVNKAEALNNLAGQTGIPMTELPKETVKLSMTVLVITPIMFVYPFVQRYVVSGVTLGAVKG